MDRIPSEENEEKISPDAVAVKVISGRKLTQEHKDKISRTMMGRRRSPSVLEKLRKFAETRRGIPRSPSFIEKIRKQKSRMMTCPYCGKVGAAGGMQRHHLERCKHKPAAVQSAEAAHAT